MDAAGRGRSRTWCVFEGPEPSSDHRGFFVRTMSTSSSCGDVGIDPASFVQESQSRSRHGVLRGLHGRTALSEGKLVRCARGTVFEVVLDLRPWSRTFLQWDSLILDDVEHRQLWVPPGMVHGFQVLSDAADICYRMDALHDPTLDLAVAWDDPEPRDPLAAPRPHRLGPGPCGTGARGRAAAPRGVVRSARALVSTDGAQPVAGPARAARQGHRGLGAPPALPPPRAGGGGRRRAHARAGHR